jgi:hypothetical protein
MANKMADVSAKMAQLFYPMPQRRTTSFPERLPGHLRLQK